MKRRDSDNFLQRAAVRSRQDGDIVIGPLRMANKAVPERLTPYKTMSALRNRGKQVVMTSFDSGLLSKPRAPSRTSTRDYLFQHARLPEALLLVGGTVIALLVFPYVSGWLLAGWLGLLLGLLLARHVLVNAYQRSPADARRKALWMRLLLAGNLCSGLALAMVHLLLVPIDSFALQAPAYAITTGISLCIAVVYASHYSVFLAFALPAWLPATLYLLFQNDPSSPYWALMGITVFGCLLLAVAFINRASRAVNRSRLRNEALLQRLEQARLQAEQLNSRLAAEVGQRREAEQQLRHNHDQLEQRVRQRTAELERASQALSASKAQLELALDASELGLWDWNLQTDQVFHSHLEAIFGLPSDSVISMRDDLNPRIHPDDFALVRHTLIAHMKGRTSTYRIEYRVRHADGHWVWIEDTGRAVEWDAQGRVLRMTGTRRDISVLHARQEADRLAATVFNTTAEGIFVLDTQLQILTVNQAFCRITGFSSEQVAGHPLSAIFSDPDYLRALQGAVSQLQAQDSWQDELQAPHHDGHHYPQWLQLRAVRNSEGRLAQVVGFFLDLTDRMQTEEQLRQLANYDSLTRLANRSLFTRRLQDAVQRAGQRQQTLAILHLNLDRFKLINETLGHELADQLLAETGTRLLNSLPQAHTLARLAADEFVIMLEQPASTEQLSALARHLLHELHCPLQMGGQELMITASIGISLYPLPAADAGLLMTQASLAMQHAKRQGGNTFAFFSEAMQARSLERLQLENQLRRALQEDQLVVHFQPRLRLSDQRLCAAEALVRWQHPQQGLLLPGVFIDIAEQTGMIISLGEQVLQQACRLASAWQQQGLEGVGVSVNLSVQQLRQSGFADQVAACLNRSGLPASLLELELTESMLMEQLPAIASNINALKAMGVRLAVDDFGTGYSSLAYLKRFPIDTLKIDRAFVAELQHGEEDRAIVRAIILMAQSLKLEVVAEGVEHAGQLELLRQFGCDEIQGFLYSRAIPVEQLVELQGCPAF